MKQFNKTLIFLVAIGLFLLIYNFKTTPNAFVNISTSLVTVPYQISQVRFSEPPLLNGSLKAVSAIHESPNVMHHPNPKVTVTKSSMFKISLKIPVRGERNIFFIESSCAARDNKTSVFMNPRQACAVESAALTNPNATIYYLDTCLGVQEFNESHPTDNVTFVSKVFHYPNVKRFHVELSTYLNDTPLSEWITNGRLGKSKYPVEHSSDVLRLVTLWKFGGLYLDLDFIIFRPLTNLKQDFVIAAKDDLISNGVLSFSADGVGHDIADMCLKELLTRFNGQAWAYNGPYLITRVMSRLCNGSLIRNMTRKNCKGFAVYHPSVFFPFYYPSWRRLFDEGGSESTMDLILKDSTYGVHAWNKMSHAEPIKVGSKQPYAQLAHRFCPRVYSVVGKTF